jgi:hypothetical protein
MRPFGATPLPHDLTTQQPHDRTTPQPHNPTTPRPHDLSTSGISFGNSRLHLREKYRLVFL